MEKSNHGYQRRNQYSDTTRDLDGWISAVYLSLTDSSYVLGTNHGVTFEYLNDRLCKISLTVVVYQE